MKGWFDAFRTDGGPTLYGANRTPVTWDVDSICLYVFFSTIYVAFLIIFPGIRKERFTTFVSVTLSVFVGFSICASQYGSSWHVADTSINSYYRAFSKEKVSADLGIHIGLMHFNVTLRGSVNGSLRLNDTARDFAGEDIDFNERFHWDSATEIQEDYRAALVKGLPFPILTVAEYLNMDEEGFDWGRQYRLAGHYASVFLWFSFVAWLLTMCLFLMVPRYGAYKMVFTGFLLLTTNFLYYILIPSKPIMIRFEDQIVMFVFGCDFWRIFGAGVLCGLVGSLIAIIDLLYPHKFSTILEVDYDTPYDRHIIIEESHDTRKKKVNPSLEEPLGLNAKIFRTLSRRKTKEEQVGVGADIAIPRSPLKGIDNRGYETDAPKSPWRYPHIMARNGPQLPPLRATFENAFLKNPALARLAAPNPSTKSPKSVSFRRQSRLETTYAEPDPSVRQKRSDSKDSSGSSNFDIPMDHPPDFPNFQSQFKPIKRSDSQESGSTVSSFGLGLLSRTQSSREHHIALSPQVSGRQVLLAHQFSNANNKSGNNVGGNNRRGISTIGGGGGSDGHLPLSRMHYNHDHIGIHQLLPRASLERKSSSSEGEHSHSNSNSNSNSSSRRGSDNSDVSSKSPTTSTSASASSAITSSSFDIAIHARGGPPPPLPPDGDENRPGTRRTSNERIKDGW